MHNHSIYLDTILVAVPCYIKYMKYVALLRGINVGGNNKIKMADLKVCLEKAGLNNVRTYIQSGNVLFESAELDKALLTTQFEQTISKTFKLTVPTVILSEPELRTIAKNTPAGWLENPEWKYNYVFLKPPYKMDQVLTDIGELKPDIEAMTAGEGILYQGMSIKLFGRTTTGKLAGKPVYKLMTIRNHNTVTKLIALLDEA